MDLGGDMKNRERERMRLFFGSSLFGGLFSVVFVLVLVIIIMTVVRNLREWNRNNNSPRLTVPARVVGKRMDVTNSQQPVAGDASGAQGFYTTSSTVYYVTFQVQSGDRMELRVGGKEYGLLSEGDFGHLTFQGTRFLSFDRFVE